MKRSIFGALLLAAALPAQAAFTINCKTTVEFGKELPLPVQWTWDGTELRGALSTPAQELETMSVKPTLFEIFKHSLRVPTTNFSFVVSVRPDDIRITQTFAVYTEGERVWMDVTTAMVRPQGLVLSAAMSTYHNCAVKET